MNNCQPSVRYASIIIENAAKSKPMRASAQGITQEIFVDNDVGKKWTAGEKGEKRGEEEASVFERKREKISRRRKL